MSRVGAVVLAAGRSTRMGGRNKLLAPLDGVPVVRRSVDAGCSVNPTPGRRVTLGRTGLGTKPPPQFGQTLCSTSSMQVAQKVHSYEQMRASSASGGRSLSQHSQFGLSSNIPHPCFS